MTLIQLAFFLLAAGATGGVVMLLLVTFEKPLPRWLGSAHGLAGLVGLILLLLANLLGAPRNAWVAFGLIALALMAGVLLFRVVYKNNIPLFLALGHGALGIFGVWLLGSIAFSG